MRMTEDPWLDRWLDVVGAPRPGLTMLELGCGRGLDTGVLLERGYPVVAADLAEDDLRQSAKAAPGASYVRLDLREPLPFADASFDVVMASLCLHYFAWDRTQRAVREIHRVASDRGLLAVRVNSTRDVNHGAVGHPEIAPHFYDVDGRPKRFFDRATIERLFADDWEMMSVQEMTIRRWPDASGVRPPKVVWELFAVKRPR